MPSRIDFIYCLAVLICLVALVETPVMLGVLDYEMGRIIAIDRHLAIAFVMLVGCLTAVASVWAWGRIEKRNAIAMIGSCVVGVFALVAGHLNLSRESILALRRVEGTPITLAESWVGGSLILAGLFYGGMLVGLFAVAYGITKAHAWIGARLSGKQNTGKVSRIKLLIGGAIALFVLAKIQSLFFPNGFGGKIEMSQSLIPFMRAIGAALLVFFLALVPAWFFTRDVDKKIQFGFILLLFLLLTAALIGYDRGYAQTRIQAAMAKVLMVTVLSFQGCFIATIFLVRRRYSYTWSSIGERTESLESKSESPSKWLVVPVLILAAGVYLVATTDVGSLVTPSATNSRFDWAGAREVRRVAIESDFDVKLMNSQWVANQFQAVLELDENSDIDVLARLSNLQFESLTLVGASPKIEFDHLASATTRWSSIRDSTLTSEQLTTFIKGGAYVTAININIQGEPESVNITNVGNFSVTTNGPGQLSQILPYLTSDDAIGVVQIYCMNEDLSGAGKWDQSDLDAIVDASERMKIRLNHLSLDLLLNGRIEKGKSLKNISIYGLNSYFQTNLGIDQAKKEQVVKFLMQHDVDSTIKLENDHQMKWDLIFARGQLPQFLTQTNFVHGDQFKNEESFLKSVQDYHWSFGTNESGQITDLYIPNGWPFLASMSTKLKSDFVQYEGEAEADPGKVSNVLKSVETLSFNENWLDGQNEFGMSGFSTENRTGSEGFELLPNLKHLDLGVDVEVVDAAFLKSIPNVEHLTINMAPRIRRSVDFAVCKNLQTLVYVGTPPKNVVKQWMTLKHLESVVILNEGDGTLNSEETVANLEKMLPNAKLTVKKEFVSRPPEKFKQHLKSVARKIRKKYLDDQ